MIKVWGTEMASEVIDHAQSKLGEPYRSALLHAVSGSTTRLSPSC